MSAAVLTNEAARNACVTERLLLGNEVHVLNRGKAASDQVRLDPRNPVLTTCPAGGQYGQRRHSLLGAIGTRSVSLQRLHKAEINLLDGRRKMRPGERHQLAHPRSL